LRRALTQRMPSQIRRLRPPAKKTSGDGSLCPRHSLASFIGGREDQREPNVDTRQATGRKSAARCRGRADAGLRTLNFGLVFQPPSLFPRHSLASFIGGREDQREPNVDRRRATGRKSAARSRGRADAGLRTLDFGLVFQPPSLFPRHSPASFIGGSCAPHELFPGWTESGSFAPGSAPRGVAVPGGPCRSGRPGMNGAVACAHASR